MSDPIVFESVSPRFALPLLFPGQAQKEAFVNEALSAIDGLIHCAIVSEIAVPPVSPADGNAWLVSTGPTGDWTGQEGKIALRQAGQWLFIEPRDGMRLLNGATGQDLRMVGGVWRRPAAPALPSGGAVIDSEVRNALTNLIAALRQAGVFSS